MKDYHDFQVMFLNQLKLLKGESISFEDELIVKNILSKTEYKLTLTIHKLLNLQRSCFEGSWTNAYEQSNALKTAVQSLTGIYMQSEYFFYRAIALLKNIQNTKGAQRLKDKVEVNAIIKKINKWGESAPSNHQHKKRIIIGLYKEVKGRFSEAKFHYANAASLADEGEFIQVEALAYYFLAELSNKNKDEKKAGHYRDKSATFFKEWGTTLIS
jgi:hypothetical protein